MAEIRVPALGESVTEATIGKWFKKAGDVVAVDEPLVELETDKVTIEVPAPAAGVLTDVAVKDGDTVAVGALLGAIKEGAGAAPAKAQAERPAVERRRRRRPRRHRRSSRSRPRLRPPTSRSRHRYARSPPKPASMPLPCPVPARTAASPRATCSPPSSGPLHSQRRFRHRPRPSRRAPRRRPTMPRARSGCG